MADENKLEENKNHIKIFYLILSNYFNLMVLIMVILVFIISYFYLFRPKYNLISEEKEKILVEKTAQRDKLQNIYNNIENYRSDYGKIGDSDKEKIKAMVVSGFDGQKIELEKIFTGMESLITGQGLILNSIVVEEKVDKVKSKKAPKTNDEISSAIGSITITMEVSGVNYTSFKSLLNKIEKNVLLMDVAKMSFSPSDNNASLTITVYYFK